MNKKHWPYLVFPLATILLIGAATITKLDNRIVDLSGSQLRFNGQSSFTNEDGLWGLSASGLRALAFPVWTNRPAPGEETLSQIFPFGTNRLADQFAFGAYDPFSTTNLFFLIRRDYDVDSPSVELKLEAQNTNADLSKVVFHSGPGAEEIYIQSTPGVSLDLWPGQTDDPGAIVYYFNTFEDRVQATGKLLSVQNHGTERFYVGNLAGQIGVAGLDYVFPITNATAGQVLQSDGGTPQHLSWVKGVTYNLTVVTNGVNTATLHITNGLVMAITAP